MLPGEVGTMTTISGADDQVPLHLRELVRHFADL